MDHHASFCCVGSCVRCRKMWGCWAPLLYDSDRISPCTLLEHAPPTHTYYHTEFSRYTERIVRSWRTSLNGSRAVQSQLNPNGNYRCYSIHWTDGRMDGRREMTNTIWRCVGIETRDKTSRCRCSIAFTFYRASACNACRARRVKLFRGIFAQPVWPRTTILAAVTAVAEEHVSRASDTRSVFRERSPSVFPNGLSYKLIDQIWYGSTSWEERVSRVPAPP